MKNKFIINEKDVIHQDYPTVSKRKSKNASLKNNSKQPKNLEEIMHSLPAEIIINNKIIALENASQYELCISLLRILSKNYHNSVENINLVCDKKSHISVEISAEDLKTWLISQLNNVTCEVIKVKSVKQYFGYSKEQWEKILRSKTFNIKIDLYCHYYGQLSSIKRKNLDEDKLIGLLTDISSLGKGNVVYVTLTINENKSSQITIEYVETSLQTYHKTSGSIGDRYRPLMYDDKKMWKEDSDNFIGTAIQDISDIHKMIKPIWEAIADPIDMYGVQLQERPEFGIFELLSELLKEHQGVIIGENHTMSLPRYYITKYLEMMQRDEVTPVNIIYDEGLKYSDYQSYLDAYFLNDSDEKLPKIFQMAMHFYNDERFRKYTVIDIITAAKATIVKRKSKHNKKGLQNFIERFIALEVGSRATIRDLGFLVSAFDYGAINSIRSTVGNKKFIVLVGEAHAPGLCARLQMPMILVRSGICNCFSNSDDRGEYLEKDLTPDLFKVKGSSNNMIFTIEGPEPVRFHSGLKRTSRLGGYGNT